VSDGELVLALLRVQDSLSDLLDAVPPERHLVVDGVLVAVDKALTGLGYEPPPECPDDDGEPS
jgi:hypothetical protein